MLVALTGASGFIGSYTTAALKRRGCTVRALVRQSPGVVTARDAGGLTPLQCCAASRMGDDDSRRRNRLLAVAGDLLDAGADPNAKTRAWRHEVDVAYFAAHDPRLFELLLDRGADATAALPTALWSSRYEELGALALRHGAKVNEATADGQPLLTNLVRWGRVEAALWLLRSVASRWS